jgi:hypothetical protein
LENPVQTCWDEALGALTQMGIMKAKYAMTWIAKTAFCQYGSIFEPKTFPMKAMQTAPMTKSVACQGGNA